MSVATERSESKQQREVNIDTGKETDSDKMLIGLKNTRNRL